MHGPVPASRHRISIWIGAVQPRMMQLIGRLGDGWVIPLSTYISKDEVKVTQHLIDAAAQESGRSPDSI